MCCMSQVTYLLIGEMEGTAEGTAFAVGNLKSRNGGNSDAGSSSSDSTAAQGQASDDEDGRQDGDP